MPNSSPLGIALFALTGMGNSALRSLVDAKLPVKLLVTREEKGAFPYYACDPVMDLATQLNVPIQFELPSPEALRKQGIDTLICATFHKILGESLTSIAKLAINVHPGAIPSNKGASPIFWSLARGADSTAITIQRLAKKIDSGEVYCAKKIRILEDDTQGSLRKRIDERAGTLLAEKLWGIYSGKIQATDPGIEGEETLRKFDPGTDCNLTGDEPDFDQRARACLPWPGVRLGGHLITDIAELRRIVPLRNGAKLRL